MHGLGKFCCQKWRILLLYGTVNSQSYCRILKVLMLSIERLYILIKLLYGVVLLLISFLYCAVSRLIAFLMTLFVRIRVLKRILLWISVNATIFSNRSLYCPKSEVIRDYCIHERWCGPSRNPSSDGTPLCLL